MASPLLACTHTERYTWHTHMHGTNKQSTLPHRTDGRSERVDAWINHSCTATYIHTYVRYMYTHARGCIHGRNRMDMGMDGCAQTRNSVAAGEPIGLHNCLSHTLVPPDAVWPGPRHTYTPKAPGPHLDSSESSTTTHQSHAAESRRATAASCIDPHIQAHAHLLVGLVEVLVRIQCNESTTGAYRFRAW